VERALQVDKQLASTNLMIAQQKIQMLEQKLRFQNMTSSVNKTELTQSSGENNIFTSSGSEVITTTETVMFTNSNDPNNNPEFKTRMDELQNTIYNLQGQLREIEIDCQSKHQKLTEEKELTKSLKKEVQSLQRRIEQETTKNEIEKMKTNIKLQDLETNLLKEENIRLKIDKEIESKNSTLQAQEWKIKTLLDQVSQIAKKSEENSTLKTEVIKLKDTVQKKDKLISDLRSNNNRPREIPTTLKKKESRTNISTVVTPLTSQKAKRLSQQYNFGEFMKQHHAKAKDNFTEQFSNINILSEESIVLKEGGLMIQEEEKNTGKKQWKRRYIILRNDEIGVYQNKTSTTEAISRININKCEVKRADGITTKPNSFMVVCDDADQFLFVADDEETCQSWISMLQNIGKTN